MAREDPGPATGATRERLLEAGLRLFADRGFHAVRVGDIEQAVGLVPRRGAMYRHFESKEALLAAAVEAHLASVAEARALYAGGDETGTATGTATGTETGTATGTETGTETGTATAEQVGAFILAEMDRQQLITQILERDGGRLVTLRQRFRQEVSDTSYHTMANILRTWLATTGTAVDSRALEALAVHLVGAMVNARRSTWTLGAPPLGLTDAELITAWSTLCRGLLDGLQSGPAR